MTENDCVRLISDTGSDTKFFNWWGGEDPPKFMSSVRGIGFRRSTDFLESNGVGPIKMDSVCS